jgi:Glycine zipper
MSICAPFTGPRPHADRTSGLGHLDQRSKDEQPIQPSGVTMAPERSSSGDAGMTDNTASCTANVQPWAQGAARGAFGSYQPSYKDFSGKPLQPLQKFVVDSPGNRLADGDGRRLYNRTTGAKATEVTAKIDAGKVTAQNGAYEAARFRDSQALQVRRTSTSPETLAKIAGTRVDKGNAILSERVNDPAKLQQHVDAKLYPKAEAKLIEQGKPAKADAVYREIVESSGRPNAAVNADAALRSAKAEKIRGAGQVLGRTALVVGAVTDGLSLKHEIDRSRETGNYDNTYKEGARIAGGWAGAWAGGKLGASSGAVIGGALGSFVPILGNGVGAAIGGIVGGLIGGFFGYKAGEQVGTGAYDLSKQS